MTTRTIVTSQPDVACYVCERRLLRGEQPEVFLAAGRPRTVCELCAPRAAHQGWKRESDPHPMSAAPLRAGRGRNLFERLRQVGRPALDSSGELSAEAAYEQESEPYDFLGSADPRAAGESSPALGDLAGSRSSRTDLAGKPAGTRSSGPLQSAIDVFNAGEYPRRVASLTRSLGAPEVSVGPGEAVASTVSILIAWELCWYRYEVDLDDLQGLETRAIAQGTELSELRQEERLANALADERGALSLADVA
jgi:hypothetical protein